MQERRSMGLFRASMSVFKIDFTKTHIEFMTLLQVLRERVIHALLRSIQH